MVHIVNYYCKTRHFSKWAIKANLNDKSLMAALLEIRSGLYEADLGGGIIKKRVALPGRGKRGGSRTLLATNHRNRWFFIFGFEKSRQDNISKNELEALQTLAADLIQLDDEHVSKAIREGILIEVIDDEA